MKEVPGYMSRAEIYKRFVSEWVLLENPKTDKTCHVLGGTLLFHSKDRDEVYRKAVELMPKHSAILYTGKIPEGTAVILKVEAGIKAADAGKVVSEDEADRRINEWLCALNA